MPGAGGGNKYVSGNTKFSFEQDDLGEFIKGEVKQTDGDGSIFTTSIAAGNKDKIKEKTQDTFTDITLEDTYPTYAENENGLFVVGTQPMNLSGNLLDAEEEVIAEPASQEVSTIDEYRFNDLSQLGNPDFFDGEPVPDPTVINGTTYQDVRTTYKNGLVTQEATTEIGSDDDLASRGGDDVISRTENDDGTVTYLFNYSVGHPYQLDFERTGEKEHFRIQDELDLVEKADTLESEIAALQGQLAYINSETVFVPPEDKEELIKRIKEKEEELIRLRHGQVENLTLTQFDQLEAERIEEELTDNATEEVPEEQKDAVLDAIRTIKEEDPEGIAMTKLNDFALWADEVTDAEALREAEAYLQELKDSPTVTERLRKAMAIAIGSMIFGEDFGTAMNTAFGIMADDYKAEADAEAAAAKDAKELAEWQYKENYKHALGLDKLAAEKGYKAKEDEAKRIAEIGTNNWTVIKDMASRFRGSLPTEEDKVPFTGIDFAGQMAGGLDWLNNNVGFRLDLKNNKAQQYAFSNTFQEWMEDKKHFGSTPRFEVYVRDMFIKTELSQYKPLNPDLISPTMRYLDSVGTDPKDVKHIEIKESVSTLNEHIQDWSATLGAEKYAIGLMVKDFEDFRKFHPTEYKVLKKSADAKGEGVFTRFVNSKLANAGYLGINYDPNVKGKDTEGLIDMIEKEIKLINEGKYNITGS